MNRHLVIVAHPDDELVFMCPAMADILRGPDPVQIIYLTAGDAAKDEAYWRSREAAIPKAHAVLRPPGGRLPDDSTQPPLTCNFLRLSDGMLQGQGTPAHGNESLIKLWHGDIKYMHALDGSARYSREDLVACLRQRIGMFKPTLLHTLNGLENHPHEHPDHHATGLFAVAAAVAWDVDVPLRFYVGSNSPHFAANVDGAALADKTAAFAAYAEDDAEIFNGRPDWLATSIYAPMLERQYFVTYPNRHLRVEGHTVLRLRPDPIIAGSAGSDGCRTFSGFERQGRGVKRSKNPSAV